MSTPSVTVILTVFNGERYVAEAIRSILGQTFPDFELLLLNDGSSDGSRALLRTFSDPRIRIIDQERNLGLIATLNHGLDEARGRWVAVMDYDDVALPDRLERQLGVLQNDPRTILCGGAIELFGALTGLGWVRYFAPSDIKTALLFENPICHPTVMMDRDRLQQLGLRYPNVLYAEDYALWVRIARRGDLVNLPTTLLRYRTHERQVSRQRSDQQSVTMAGIIREQLEQLGLRPTPQELLLHQLLGSAFNPIPDCARRVQAWAERLISANRAAQVYPAEEFAAQIRARAAAAPERNVAQLRQMSGWRRARWRIGAWRRFHKAGHA